MSGNTKTAPKIPTLAAGSETIWLMDKGVEVPKSHYDLVHFLRDLWDDVAEIKKNGKVIAQRVAYGKPMLALDETLFKPDAYDDLIETDLVGEKTKREIVVGDLTEDAAAALMRGFIRSQEN
ncbi:hypothetical protein GRR92_02100 [Lactococcus lactis subsp. lactis]|uniref:hypothetical protein n=1 Tax=Lactococcus lactis TaxID=1358 RepID=UPI0010BEBA89|nr:hypothetical protein [Lactococcus lactis]MBR8672950.1 hypothetical protein [Lactococcus lactis subsp. lactis]MBR8675956.1 hypothetical protein [Lactococcus lactis subsp. lactis]MBR8683438.1 hypothetical protein [Lactococcus lactis subsp. lactis]NLS47295.1 hypothetical protein [Lactococcus lactis]TKD78655.1 hypothetical protein E6O52_03060 [Lactococcus lactis]